MRRGKLNIQCMIVGKAKANCYIVNHIDRKECIIIDPGDDIDDILSYLNKKGLVVKGIFLTHGHFDHVMIVEELRCRTGASVYAHEKEKNLLLNEKMNSPLHKIDPPIELQADVYFEDETEVSIADLKFKVIYTPGHTDGSVCYLFEDEQVLFSGDTLFSNSIGRTDLPTGSTKMICHSIKDKLYELSEYVEVFSGHGFRTSIGREKVNNPYVVKL